MHKEDKRFFVNYYGTDVWHWQANSTFGVLTI